MFALWRSLSLTCRRLSLLTGLVNSPRDVLINATRAVVMLHTQKPIASRIERVAVEGCEIVLLDARGHPSSANRAVG